MSFREILSKLMLHNNHLTLETKGSPAFCSSQGVCELENTVSAMELNDTEVSILRNMRAAKRLYDERTQTLATLEEIADLANAMLWRKNAEGVYEYCSKTMCDMFFRLPPSCHDGVIGKSDIDLINNYRERTGKRHTFGELCVNTDVHCVQQGTRCVYLEMGWIDEEPLFLSVRKAPLYDEDKVCIGTVGFAVDVTYKCDELILDMYNRIARGVVEQLAPGVFWIKKEENVCHFLKVGEVPDISALQNLLKQGVVVDETDY